MRKFIALFMLSITIISVASCSPETDSVKQKSTEETQMNEQTEESAAEDEDITATPTPTVNNNYQNYTAQDQVEEEQDYSVTIAISNAIVINDGSRDDLVTYKYKCDSCGYVEPGTHTTAPGSFKGGFYCPECEETKVVELKTEYYHE